MGTVQAPTLGGGISTARHGILLALPISHDGHLHQIRWRRWCRCDGSGWGSRSHRFGDCPTDIPLADAAIWVPNRVDRSAESKDSLPIFVASRIFCAIPAFDDCLRNRNHALRRLNCRIVPQPKRAFGGLPFDHPFHRARPLENRVLKPCSSGVGSQHQVVVRIVVRKLRQKIEVDPTRPRILLTDLGIWCNSSTAHPLLPVTSSVPAEPDARVSAETKLAGRVATPPADGAEGPSPPPT